MKTTLLATGALLVAATAATAQQRPDPESRGGGNCSANVYNCALTPNPLPAPNTVWLEEMTWMDVRDAVASGKTTALIVTGGVEPNGPFLAMGKHNYVLHANCDAIARELGDAICAPIVKTVPEGDISPPTGHMQSPGTISMREETFEALLTDIASSLKMHGFRNIIFFGDSGGNQQGQRAVAERLNAMWPGVVVAHVQEYYDYATVAQYMTARGIRDGESDRMHDDPIISLNMFADDPASIRYAERVDAGLASINGVSLEDRVQNLEWARQIVDFRAMVTSRFIRQAIAQGGTTPLPERSSRFGGGGGPPAGFQRPEPDPRDMGGGRCADNPFNCADTPNPLPRAETLWIEEMTWMDVRDALAEGKTTAIISTGGMEPNGPWLVTGKHNYVLRANCPRIAAHLGNALCAPVLEYVPEGNIDPPSGHMRSSGTVSLREETFEAVLTDMAESLHQHGFRNIVFIGDSGGNQDGMQNVAHALSAKWGGGAHFIGEYYRSPPGSRNVLRELGVTHDGMPSDGLHDSPGITLNMMLDDPSSVRWAERVRTRQATINGVDISDLTQSLMWAEEIADARSERTANIIRDRIAGR